MAKRYLTIGFFLEHYEPFTSGVITATKALKAELKRRGHKVYIICPKVRGYVDKDPDVIRTRAFSHHALQNTTIGLPLPGDAKRLAKYNFDIIHSQEVFYNGGLGLVTARRLNVPFVQHYHTLWNRFLDHYHFPFYVYACGAFSSIFYYPLVFGPKALFKLFSRSDRQNGRTLPARVLWRHMLNVGRVADVAISPSIHLINSLKLAGLKTPIEHLPNGIEPVDIQSSNRNDKLLRVLSVARLSPEKRVDILIESIAQTSDAQLDIIGVGPTEVSLKSLVSQHDLDDRVNFLGELPNHIVRQHMAEADVLALASYNFDNQPVVFIEALAAGLPIIYCDPKLRECLTTQNSLLVDNTPAGFSKGFGKLKDSTKRQGMSKAAEKQFGQFSVSATADKLLKIYNEAIDNHAARK